MAPCKALGRGASFFALSLCLLCSVAVLCQQAGHNSPNKNQNSAKTSTAAKDGSPDANAFPMSQSEAAAKAASQQRTQENKESGRPDNPARQKPDAPSGDNSSSRQSKAAAAQDNPFPEAQSKAAAKADDGASGAAKAGDAQAGSSSSASGYSSSDANLPPSDLGQGTLGSHPKLDTFTRDQTQDGRIEDDLKVADLYMKNGNYRGALWRYQDTLQYDPQNDTALYGVAEAMCKQNLTAEAMARFKSYGKNHPQGKYAIKAEQMLAHPNKCMHNW